MRYRITYGQSLHIVRGVGVAVLKWIQLTGLERDLLKSSPWSCNMTAPISTVEAYVATVSIASELTSGMIGHGAEMSYNILRVSKPCKHTCVSVTFYVF
jgi:hypothetical protein